jgi:glycosyltransferase involved in cell wall biosynthesis
VNQSRKILIASFTYPPNKDGVSESAVSMAEGLAARGHDVVVATGEPDLPGTGLLPPSRVQIERFRISGSPLQRKAIIGEIERYRNFAQLGGFDAIICMCLDSWPTFLLLPVLPSLKAVKILLSHGFSAHQWYPNGRFPWGLGSWGRGLLFTLKSVKYQRLFDTLIFLDSRVDLGRFFDHTIAKLFRHPRLAILPNSVDDSFFESPKQSFRSHYSITQTYMFVCVANYSTRKNQQLAIRAFADAAIPDAALICIGSQANEYYRELASMSDSLILPAGSTVKLFTGTPREYTIAAVQEATASVLTAKEETQPLFLLESMAAGTPFISTRTGCVSEMPGGIIAGSLESIAAAMTLLVRDPTNNTSMAARGREYATLFCRRHKMIDMMEALIVETVP